MTGLLAHVLLVGIGGASPVARRHRPHHAPGFAHPSPAARHAHDAAIGALPVVFALARWLVRPARTPRPEVDGRHRLGHPGQGFLFGTIRMGTGVGALALFVSGLKEIVAADLGAANSAIAFALFVLVVEMALVVPIALYKVAPGRAGAMLGHASRWLENNTRPIIIVLFAAFGILQRCSQRLIPWLIASVGKPAHRVFRGYRR